MTTTSPPRPLSVHPTSLTEAADLLRAGAADRNTVGVAGGGTKAGWGGVPARPDLLVGTDGLDRLLAYNPGDLTAFVQAGMPLARLQEILAPEGQWLALDPPTEAAGATIGGLLAAADSGPRRLRYGSMRDLVIGTTLVLADGTIATSGGRVIKNVAGYDLSKLAYGSLGTLGLIGAVSLRLHPKLEASRTLRAEATAGQATAAALALLASAAEPTAVEWTGAPAGSGTLLVRVEGTGDGVDPHAGEVLEVLSAQGLRPEPVPDETAAWDVLTAEVNGTPDASLARAGTRPSRLGKVADRLASAAEQVGVRARLVSSAALGLHTCVLTGGTPAGHALVLHRWRSDVRLLGGEVSLRQRPAATDALVEPVESPTAAVALLRRVKTEFDPDARMAPGRFGSWF